MQEIAGKHKKTNEHVAFLWNLNGQMQLQLWALASTLENRKTRKARQLNDKNTQKCRQSQNNARKPMRL
jgi:hypothetical protein